MASSDLRDELAGLRGFPAYKRLQAYVTRFVGRSFWYDHLAASIDSTLISQQRKRRPPNYYEFGTGSGGTLQKALAVLKKYPDSRIFLFDSFEGLPEPRDGRDAHACWTKGEFSYSEEYIAGLIRRNGFDPARVRFVKGFFENSLTPDLGRELRSHPPAFVTIDVDYYSSTVQALDFLMPLLASGTVIYFDDLWAFDGHPEHGQLKAISEFNSKNTEGQLTPNQILGNRTYSYYKKNYEFLTQR